MRFKMGVWTYSTVTSADINDETNEFSVNGTKVPFSQGFLHDAINIVKNWPDHIEDNDKTDGVVYKITYNDGQQERTVTGNNKTPEDFELLMYMLNQHVPKTEKERKDEEFLKLISEYRIKRYEGMEDGEDAKVNTDIQSVQIVPTPFKRFNTNTNAENLTTYSGSSSTDVWEREW